MSRRCRSASLTPDAKLNVKWDVAHPDVLTLETVVGRDPRLAGLRAAADMAPPRLSRVVSSVADVLGYLGWRSPRAPPRSGSWPRA